MSVAIALFTADLRVHDNPVLCGALSAADQVVPLFVLDDGVRAAGFMTPNRAAFLAGCLADLDKALRERGGRLVLRIGDVVRKVPVPRVGSEPLPDGSELAQGRPSPGLPLGGEREARRRADAWLDGPIDQYADLHDDLPGDGTSRLSPYLHFGCLSAAELVHRAVRRGGAGTGAATRRTRCSTRSCRHVVSIRRATMCAAGCPNSRRWAARPCTGPGVFRRRSAAASTTPSPSWT